MVGVNPGFGPAHQFCGPRQFFPAVNQGADGSAGVAAVFTFQGRRDIFFHTQVGGRFRNNQVAGAGNNQDFPAGRLVTADQTRYPGENPVPERLPEKLVEDRFDLGDSAAREEGKRVATDFSGWRKMRKR